VTHQHYVIISIMSSSALCHHQHYVAWYQTGSTYYTKQEDVPICGQFARSPTPAAPAAAASQWPAKEKHAALFVELRNALHIFVPSLSWQDDRFPWKKQMVETESESDPHRCGCAFLRRLLSRRRRRQRRRKHRLQGASSLPCKHRLLQ
jgi:hypothetical protein